MQNFLSLWLNAWAQITHGGQVQRPRQKLLSKLTLLIMVDLYFMCVLPPYLSFIL